MSSGSPLQVVQSTIGSPSEFRTGPFAGLTIRATLEELQKADLGRKYGRKDRRPLDPPPVVQLRLFQVLNAGTSTQTEKELDNYSDVAAVGLVCHVDLFPACADEDTDDWVSNEGDPTPTSPMTISSLPTSRLSSVFAQPMDDVVDANAFLESTSFPHSLQKDPTPTDMSAAWPSPNLESLLTLHSTFLESHSMLPPPSAPQLSWPSVRSPLTMPSGSFPSSTRVQAGGVPAADYLDASDVIAHIGGFPITASSVCTHQLAGTTNVDASCILHQGKTSFLFVFSDLSVKKEGTYVLRYRVFDIFAAATGSCERPALAECFSGTFRIYSAKDFPGLRSSTDLTKHIGTSGVRLNSRLHARRKRKHSDEDTQSGRQMVPNVPAFPPLSEVVESFTKSMPSTSMLR